MRKVTRKAKLIMAVAAIVAAAIAALIVFKILTTPRLEYVGPFPVPSNSTPESPIELSTQEVPT